MYINNGGSNAQNETWSPPPCMGTFASGRWTYRHSRHDKLPPPVGTLCGLETNPETMDSADWY